MEEKIKELFSDQAFAEKVMALETPEEVQALLAENDVEISVEEIRQVNDLLVKKASGDLSEEELEKVSGGFALALTCAIIGGIAGLFGLTLSTAKRW